MKIIKVFKAAWCGPCAMFEPVITQVIDGMKNKPPVSYVDVDKEPDEAASFGIRGLPTVIIFDGDDIVAEKVGAMTAEQFTSFVSEHI